MDKIYSHSYYGSRVGQYETATFDLEWSKDDPRLGNFCNCPYETVLYYKISEDGTKEYVKVEIDGKTFVPGELK